MRKTTVLFFVTCALAVQALPWLPLQAQTLDTLAELDAIFAPFHNQMPGVAVAVSIDGRVIYNRAYGLANLEYNVPNTPQTLFEAGSVSKQFVAAGILLLAKEGKLTLHDDVRTYVPELPDYGTPVTLDMLLSHTSGLKDWGALYSLTGWPRTTRVYTQELGWDIIFKQKSLNFPPGTLYSYSNSNYMMLVLVLERVSGLTLAQFTEKYFFEPLNMEHTLWRDNHLAVVPGRATAYRGQDGRFLLNMPFEDLHGPGGLLTTTSDLLRWNRLHESLEILGEEFATNRIIARKTTNGQDIGYAAGHTIGTLNGYREVAHSGSTGGYRAWLAWYPQKRLSVVLLSNYAEFAPVVCGRRIASLFLEEDASAKVPAAAESQQASVHQVAEVHAETPPELSDYAGTYYSTEVDTRYVVLVEEGTLKVGRKAGDEFELSHRTGDRFTSENNGEYTFERDRRGKVTGLKVSVMRAQDVPFYRLIH